MSFAFGNSGGFGSNNNNQSSGFGGFGSGNNNNTSGFGSNNNSGSIFGQSNNGGGSAFGASNNNNSGFGGGGFGANNNTTTSFGSKPFGSTGNNMFGGSGGNTSSFGGFGASNNTSTTPAFGGGSNSGGLFGQSKPAFGATTTNTGSSLFGGGNNTNTGGGFGSNTSTGFGASNTAGGFGANNSNAPAANNGTGTTPFQAIQEKEAGTANNNVQYQTITFQPPYQNFSLEELRTVDYNQGRRYGNSNGQAGAFGQSTGFGGFGANNNTTAAATGGFGSTANNNTGGGLFGGNSNTSFGQNSNTGTGFGANTNNTSGGLFGSANKPAGGSVFGSTPATNNTGGGLFGNAANNNTGGGFGATNNNSGGFGASNAGGGLFGGNNNANNQNKPAGFGGGFAANNNAGGGFGANNNTGGSSLFGASTNNNATPGFGANNQAAGAGSSLFGNSTGGFGQNQQNQQQQAGGGLFGGGGGGGFGQNAQNNQQKPGGLFGNSTGAATGGGLFGNSNNQQQQQQQQQPAAGGLFGNKPATGGGLFGNSAAPATGGGLFGQSNNAGATGGGLFGNAGAQNNQQAAGGGLFGNVNNQQKPGGGLFGNSAGANNTNTGLFGQSNQGNNQLGGSLFGGQNQAQQNQQPMNNSLFGASGGSLLQTSMNTNPYGNDALFSGLGTPSQSPGPLATPLSSSQKNRKSAILPQHKLNPSQSTRLLTPQGKRNGGYGFSYSTYGTPTGSSQNSPLNGSIFSSGNLSRSLGKSLSTSNLRNGFTPDTSILAPGAFSATGRSFGSGSLKKLNINRTINMRPSLFDEPQSNDTASSSTKRVSFAGPSGEDAPTTNGSLTNGSPKGSSPTGSSGALVLHQDESATENRTSISPRPEMQQVNGNELATVPENSALTPRTTSSLNIQNGKVVDPKPGSYYSEPSMETLKAMSKDELKSVSNFVVGRDKIGRVEFNMGKPVNLSEIDLDQIFGEIVEFKPRHVAVYGPKFRGQKPALGAPGLNQPSRITLGNSWPKGATKAGKDDPGHVHRLKRINNGGTNFESFDADTGIWVFSVPHFSTYGLDYEEYEESSPLSAVPETPDQFGTSQMTVTPENDSTASASQSSPDDTFDFKKGMRQRAVVPGQFGSDAAYEQEEEDETEGQSESFLGERSVGSLDGQEDYTEESESDSTEDQEMADSVSGPVRTTERSIADATDPFKESAKPKSILKASQLLRPMGTPSKGPLVFDDDWANTLQRTISPKKQDRKALRESQGHVLRERDNNAQPKASVAGGRSEKLTMDRMDLMDSLFGETDKRKDSTMKRVGQGIQLPYAKRPKTSNDLHEMAESDKEFHSCNKPHFSENGVLVYAGKHLNTPADDLYAYPQEPIAGAGNDIRFKRLPTFPDGDPPTLNLQKEFTKVSLIEGVPKAHPPTQPTQIDFERIAEVVDLSTVAGEQEHKVWQLLHILFDQMPEPVDVDDYNMDADRWRKEQLSTFWKSLVLGDAEKQARGSDLSPEEKAIAYLSGNSVPDACHTLIHSSDFRLATLVAQIGGDDTMRQDMTAQIEDWRRMDVLPEIDDSKRALYELISGNCAKAEGNTGGGRENKASSFIISSRFNLDWRRAFGLRLWYGTKVDEPIELAVAQYADALRDEKEDVKPAPWFIEQGTHMGWTDEHKDTREDLLWGILKLYASSKMEVPANVEDVLAPENVSGHPLNARLSFQLFNIFKARVEDPQESEERIVGMPMVRDGDDHNSSFLSTTSATTDQDGQAEDAMVELGDKLALTYAASLHTPEHWVTAVWVYTHLSQAATREHYIRSLLAQFSNTFSLADSDATFTKLLGLSVPSTWAHAAAALQAKTEGDALRQAMHLIKADELEEAHEVLCRSVGPESIISRDYDALRELLGGFVPTPPNSPDSDSGSGRRRQKEPVQGWSYGGQIYFDYIELLDLTDQRSGFRENEDLNHQITYLLGKLSKALEIVARDRLASVGLEERVALTEIASVVADEIAKNKMSDRSRVLKLPLTEDKWLKHTIDLSVDYYRNVVADAVR